MLSTYAAINVDFLNRLVCASYKRLMAAKMKFRSVLVRVLAAGRDVDCDFFFYFPEGLFNCVVNRLIEVRNILLS